MISPDSRFSWPERQGKRLRHLVKWLQLVLHWKRQPPAVVCWPDLPSRRTTISQICKALNFELTNQPRRSAVCVMRFEDSTLKRQAIPHALGAGIEVWNEQLEDIRKSTLDAHHEDVFGYGVRVDPRVWQGRMLEKGNGNAVHDGRECNGPIPQPLEGKVYQRIVDNRDADGRFVDVRLVYIRGEMPLAYLKYKRDDARYTNETTAARRIRPSDAMSTSELLQIAELMMRMRVDFAELDVLRDRRTARLFVVDVNPTPWGPPAGLPPEDSAKSVDALASAFLRALRRSDQSIK